jgi:hypothetical protein
MTKSHFAIAAVLCMSLAAPALAADILIKKQDWIALPQDARDKAIIELKDKGILGAGDTVKYVGKPLGKNIEINAGTRGVENVLMAREILCEEIGGCTGDRDPQRGKDQPKPAGAQP